MTQEWKIIKAERKRAKKILKALIPKAERKERRDANRLGEIRENCERNGYSYFKLGSTKLNPITNKHSGKKEKINVSELPERKVLRKFAKSTDRKIHLDEDGFRKNASKETKRRLGEAILK